MPLPDADLATDLGALRQRLPKDFLIGYSGDWGCAAALQAGADCWYSVAGGTLPGPSVALADAAMSKDAEETIRLDDAFAGLWELFQEFGSLRVVYAVANVLNLTSAEPPLPLRPMPPEALPRLEAALSQLSDVS